MNFKKQVIGDFVAFNLINRRIRPEAISQEIIRVPL